MALKSLMVPVCHFHSAIASCPIAHFALVRVILTRSPGTSPMSAFFADLRFGFRLLRRHPGISIVAIVTLALGIGANSAIFSVVDAVMVRQLPYTEPDRLVKVWEKRPAEG